MNSFKTKQTSLWQIQRKPGVAFKEVKASETNPSLELHLISGWRHWESHQITVWLYPSHILFTSNLGLNNLVWQQGDTGFTGEELWSVLYSRGAGDAGITTLDVHRFHHLLTFMWLIWGLIIRTFRKVKRKAWQKSTAASYQLQSCTAQLSPSLLHHLLLP